MCRRLASIVLLLGMAMGHSVTQAAAPIPLADLAALQGASSAESPSVYVLNDGDYTVTAPLAIAADAYHDISLRSGGSSLSADNTGRSTVLLSLKNLSVAAGAVSSVGGTGAGAHGLAVDTVTVGNGTLSAKGGTGTGGASYGISAAAFTQNGGTVTIAGGDWASWMPADVKYGVSAGTFSLAGGSLTTRGGTQGNSAGVRATTFTQDGGTAFAYGSIDSRGGYSYGISAEDIVHNAGDMTATSGVTYGIHTRNYTQNGGTVTASSHATMGSYGIYAYQSYTLTAGSITATGTTSSSVGLNSAAFSQTGGDIKGYGGQANNAYGFQAQTFTQTAGSVTGFGGGGGLFAWGVKALTLNQDGGSVTGFGGTGASMASGVDATTYNHYSGTATGTGGSGDRGSTGISATTYNQFGGDVVARGGPGRYVAAGLLATNYNMQGGTLAATGGAGEEFSLGAYISAQFTQSAGTATDTAGDRADAYGIYTEAATLNGGSMTGQGGTADGCYGVVVSTGMTQNGGTLTGIGGTAGVGECGGVYIGGPSILRGTVVAVGGSGSAMNFGMFLDAESHDLYGTMRLSRQGAAPSVFFNDSAVTLRNGSTIVPLVDLSAAGPPTSGLIQTTAGSTFTIESGARVDPVFLGGGGLAVNTTQKALFIDTDGAGIAGAFANGSGGGLTYAYTVEKSADETQYYLTYTRLMKASDALEQAQALAPRPNYYPNSRSVIVAIEEYLRGNPGAEPLQSIIARLDNSGSLAEFRSLAAGAGRSLTPQPYAKLTQSFMHMIDLSQLDFTRQMNALLRRRPAGRVSALGRFASAEGWASAACPSEDDFRPAATLRLWTTPLYQQSSRFDAATAEFDDAKEKYRGIAVGAAKDFGILAAGGSFDYLDGDYRSAVSRIDSRNYGFTGGARLHDLAPEGNWFNPWVEATGHYTYSDLRQNAVDYFGVAKESSPHANLFRASLEAGNAVVFADSFSLGVRAGFDYTNIRQSGYAETGASDLNLRVRGGSYNSFRPKVGVDAEVAIAGKLSLTGRADYRYETADKRSAFYSDFASFPGVAWKTVGEDLGRTSGNIGAGVSYRPNRLLEVSANYDLHLAEKYAAHQFSASLALSF